MNHIDIFELRRGMFHILAGIAFILIVLYLPYGELFLFIVLVLGGFASFLSTQFNVPIISNCLCFFERECNLKFPGRGVLLFFVGSLLSLRLFSREIALASILILTFADPISHFVGANFGRISGINRRKKLEGTFAGILVGTLFASFLVHPLLAFAGAFIAMFLEAIEIAMAQQTIDDNLLIPLIAGTTMYLLSLRFGFI